jgi:hypothetical protein
MPDCTQMKQVTTAPFPVAHVCPCGLQVLNYGQSVFEGMKAQRTPSGGVVLFRWGGCSLHHASGVDPWRPSY